MKPVVHQYEDKLLEFAYGELPRPEAEAVEAHLRGCAKCTEALSHIGVVRRTMGRLPLEAAPDAGLESLLAYAEQHAQRAAGATKRKPWWRGLVLGLATVASVLVAGVVAWRASDDFNPDPTRDLRQLDKADAKKAAPALAPAAANAVAPTGGERKEGAEKAALKDLEPDRLAEAPRDVAGQAAPEEQKPEQKAPPTKRGGFGLEDQTVAQNWRNASPEVKAKELRQGKQQGGVDQPAAPAPKPVSTAKPAEFAKADQAAAGSEGWGGAGVKAPTSAGDEATQRESAAKRAAPKKKGKASEAPPAQGVVAKGALKTEEKPADARNKEEERRVAAAEPAAPSPQAPPAQTVAAANPPPPPAAQPQQPAQPGFGVSANQGAGRSSTGSSSGGSYQLAPLTAQRGQGNDDSADLAGQAETVADKKRADADADDNRRKGAAEVTGHLELATKYGNGGQRMLEVKECLQALKLGAAGAQRLEALKRLCDAFNAVGEPDQADSYCDRVVLEFPNSAYARQIGEARHNVQHAPAPRAAEKRAAPVELDEAKKSKATKKAVDDAAY